MLKKIAICAAFTLAVSVPALAQDMTQPQETAAASTAAGDVPQAVIDACKDDYEAHCSEHAHESTAARDCMAHAFEKLSDPCVTAILDSPLVDQNQRQAENTAPSAAPKTRQKALSAKPTKSAPHRVAAKHAAHRKFAARKTTRHAAYLRSKSPRRSVTAQIRRGTGIAKHYVSKYTRLAFAKAFK